MIVTVKEDFDKDQGTDLPMFSRVGKTTVSMYIAFSQAAMNKHEEEDYLKHNPGVTVEEYRQQKKDRQLKKADDGGLGTLKDQRDALLKNEETIVSMSRIDTSL